MAAASRRALASWSSARANAATFGGTRASRPGRGTRAKARATRPNPRARGEGATRIIRESTRGPDAFASGRAGEDADALAADMSSGKGDSRLPRDFSRHPRRRRFGPERPRERATSLAKPLERFERAPEDVASARRSARALECRDSEASGVVIGESCRAGKSAFCRTLARPPDKSNAVNRQPSRAKSADLCIFSRLLVTHQKRDTRDYPVAGLASRAAVGGEMTTAINRSRSSSCEDAGESCGVIHLRARIAPRTWRRSRECWR